MALYDSIGTGYDSTRRADPYLATRLTAHLEIAQAAAYLDMACGTGNYTTVVSRNGGQWHGVDLSRRMLTTAQGKGSSVQWYQADAAALPFPAGLFSGIMCTLALHHLPALTPAFQEVRRVLGSGTFVILTSTAEQMRGYWLNEYFPVAMERSIQQMPALDLIQGSLKEAGFTAVNLETYGVTEDLQDLFLYSGKQRPEIYLEPNFRKGISTFASLADGDEVENGLRLLEQDIRSGRITQVMRRFENTGGDYLFLIAR